MGVDASLFRDPAVGRFYKHDSPYTYFTSKELHLGEISLECPGRGGGGSSVGDSEAFAVDAGWGVCQRGWRRDGRRRWNWIGGCGADERFELDDGGRPELDIVVWKMRADDGEEGVGSWHNRFFQHCARRNLHLALVQLPQFWFGSAGDSRPCDVLAVSVDEAGT